MRPSSLPEQHPRPGLSRRSVALTLGGAALLGGPLAGCDLDDLTGRGPGGPLGTGDEPAEDPDRRVVDAVVVDLDAQLAALVAARRSKRLRSPLAPLTRMHRAHRAALVQADSATPAPSPTASGTTSVATLAVVRTDATAYQQRLVAAALAAQSGALASVLASMSASIAQHLAQLPSDPNDPNDPGGPA